MPNGFHGSNATWERINAPLASTDPILDVFASDHGLTVSRSERNWPDRSMQWRENDIERKIQINLDGTENDDSWSLWLCAWKDRSDGRYLKIFGLKEKIPMAEMKSALRELLDQGFQIISTWTENDLEKAK